MCSAGPFGDSHVFPQGRLQETWPQYRSRNSLVQSRHTELKVAGYNKCTITYILGILKCMNTKNGGDRGQETWRMGAERVREVGEERAGSGSSKRPGNAKRWLSLQINAKEYYKKPEANKVWFRVSIWMLKAVKWIGWLSYFVVHGSTREKLLVWVGKVVMTMYFVGRCCATGWCIAAKNP